MKVIHCSRCGAYIQSNELRYLVAVHITLDRDGLGNASVTDTAQRLAAIRRTDETIIEQLACEKAFTLCGPCRDQFMDNPLGESLETAVPDRGFVQ